MSVCPMPISPTVKLGLISAVSGDDAVGPMKEAPTPLSELSDCISVSGVMLLTFQSRHYQNSLRRPPLSHNLGC